MSFGQRLKKQRIAAGLTQSELAKLSSITSRTIQNYELEASSPKNIEVVNKLANALGVSQSILLNDKDMYVIEAHEKGGAKSAKDISELVENMTSLFAGGTLHEEDLEGAMKAINEAYWIAKEKNKKYTPKKYRK